MEMPIRIMIVLFVALVVGAMMITFAKQVLFPDGGTPVPIPTRGDDDDVISFPTLKSNHVVALASTCIDENLGRTIERKRCFVVLAENSEYKVLDVEDELRELYPRLEIVTDLSITDDAKSMVIYFDPTTLNNTLEINPT